MFHQKWPAPPFSGKLRRILDRNLTPDSSKDIITTQTETPAAEITAQPSYSSNLNKPITHLQEHLSLTKTTQAAFNHALHHEFNDLFFFACNKTFSGENVLFLRLAWCWKACWSLILLDTDENLTTTTTQRRADTDTECPVHRKIFSVAVEMFLDFINPSTACKLLLNLEHGLADELETVLGDAARSILPTGTEHERAAVVGVVAPFTTPDRQEDMIGYSDLLGLWWDLVSGTDETSIDNLHEKPLPALPASTTATTHSFRLLKMKPRVSQTAVIPEAFSTDIFDHVESSVYHMVLRDTFPKYVSWRKLKDAESGSS